MSRVGSGTHTSTDRDASREETSAHALDLRHPEDVKKDEGEDEGERDPALASARGDSPAVWCTGSPSSVMLSIPFMSHSLEQKA